MSTRIAPVSYALVMSGAGHMGRLDAARRRVATRIDWERRRRGRLRDAALVPGLTHDRGAPIMILSPHPDDAVFNCWSVLAAGRPVTVVNVFAGVPTPGSVTPWDRICAAGDSAAHMRARLAEDRAALAGLGSAPVCLPLPEEQYRATPPTLRDLDRALTAAAPRACAVYAPAAVGASHADHRLVRSLARAIGRSGVPVTLYADLPYAARHGWPHWVTGSAPPPHLDVDAYWEGLVRAVPEIGDIRAAHVVRLDADTATRKLGAMRSYATQFRALDWGGLLSDPVTHGHEVFWSLGDEAPA
jgi:LmbE family N-acetylglucosaminyl deacetylase